MYQQDADYMPYEERSSEEDIDSDSSDDDLCAALRGDRKKQHALQRRNKPSPKADSEDEFEKEMTAELSSAVKALENERRKSSADAGVHPNKKGNEGTEFYDAAYFDSDSDDEGTKKEKATKHPVLSNDELLYDPDADDEDQKWVDSQQQRYQCKPSSSKEKTSKRRALPNSDAVLDCPACMTTLCLDCQRHDKYQNQYRAMFVLHCTVDTTQTLSFPQEQKKKKKRKKPRFEDATSEQPGNPQPIENGVVDDGSDKFHPVRCEICSTEVGVYDSDEVYHFFNVLASYS